MNGKRIIAPLILAILLFAVTFGLCACAPSELPKIEGVSFENAEYTYDANNVVDRTLEVTGLPAGASVTYSPKNTYSAPGTYVITAEITKEGYQNLTLTATLKITQSTSGAGGNEDALTVKFETLCSTTIANVKVAPGDTVARPTTTLYRTGYIFSDWYHNGERWNFSTPITEDITLTAKWDISRYSINYHIDGGATMPSDAKKTYTIEDETFALSTPITNPGVRFFGWYDASGDTPMTSVEKGSYGTIDVWAKLDFEKYDITYNLVAVGALNNALNPTEVSGVNAGTAIHNPSATGYEFLGWYTTPSYDEGTKITNFPDTVNAPITLYAKWNLNRFNITYVLNGGTNNSLNPTECSYIDNITLQPATKTGEKFLGWFSGSKQITTISETLAPLTLEARWASYDYLISYSLGMATNSENNPIGINTTDAVITLEPAYLEGYVFDGWYNDMYSGVKITSITPSSVTDDITLYARFTTGTLGLCYTYNNGVYEVSSYVGTDSIVSIPSIYNGKNVTSISSNAFEGTAVTEVNIPLSITEIGAYAFKNCTSLSKITIVKSVQTVGAYAFFGCTSLESITCAAKAKPDGFDSKFNYKSETQAITVNYNSSSLVLPSVPLG